MISFGFACVLGLSVIFGSNVLTIFLFANQNIDGGAWPYLLLLHAILDAFYGGTMVILLRNLTRSSEKILGASIVVAILLFMAENYKFITTYFPNFARPGCNLCALLAQNELFIYFIYFFFPIFYFLIKIFMRERSKM